MRTAPPPPLQEREDWTASVEDLRTTRCSAIACVAAAICTANPLTAAGVSARDTLEQLLVALTPRVGSGAPEIEALAALTRDAGALTEFTITALEAFIGKPVHAWAPGR